MSLLLLSGWPELSRKEGIYTRVLRTWQYLRYVDFWIPHVQKGAGGLNAPQRLMGCVFEPQNQENGAFVCVSTALICLSTKVQEGNDSVVSGLWHCLGGGVGGAIAAAAHSACRLPWVSEGYWAACRLQWRQRVRLQAALRPYGEPPEGSAGPRGSDRGVSPTT